MLHEDVGTQFLALQGTGAAISQRVSGLAPGSVYEVRLLAANRPGYGGDETLVIKVDNHVVWESNHPADTFTPYGVGFVAKTSSSTIQIENNSPDGDRTIFIDEIQVIPVRMGAPVQLQNPGFDDPSDVVSSPCPAGNGDCAYKYARPHGWVGTGNIVMCQNGNQPCVESESADSYHLLLNYF
jgi:hypothetical protein